MRESLLKLEDPDNYYAGSGKTTLGSPMRILCFLRKNKHVLQKHALQNRSHHRFVLLYNLGTEGQVHLDDAVSPIKPGQVILIHPYQFHHFSGLQSHDLCWLFCTFELEEQSILEPLKNRVIDTNKELDILLEQMLEIWHHKPSELQALRLQASLLSLILTLKQICQQSEPDHAKETEESLLNTVNQLMAKWRGRPVSIEEIAAATKYSTSRLRVVFKQAAGIPLGSYIKNYRMNHAMALLRTTSKSITEIASQAGFASPQAFSRSFRKETGKTPRSYRKRT
ncbi:MAG: AraC family transcriptional regulator [Akkermansiaceae bacterium]